MNTTFINYPKDKSYFIFRIGITVFATAFIIFLIVKNFIDINIESLALGFLAIVGLFDTFIRIHRLITYDEISFDNENFTVKKNNIILSSTPIENIEVHSKTNPFNFFGISWRRFYADDKLLFHYETNEIEKEDEILLKSIL